MKILTNKNNVIEHIGDCIEFGIFDEPDIQKWKVDEHLFILHSGQECYEADNVSNEICTYKYCYTPEQGFYLNPNWIEPPIPAEQRLDELEKENEMLRDNLNKIMRALNLPNTTE